MKNTEDFGFFFRTMIESIAEIFECDFNPEILIADGAHSIRNAFMSVFTNALLVKMCYAHVLRNVNKRPLKNAKKNRKLILEDIGLMHLAPNSEIFSVLSKLFLKKWKKIEPDFIEYFNKQWLGSHKNWYESAAIYSPSTNNK